MKHKPEQQENTDEFVDRDLVAMFLQMTPEQRITANDTMMYTITELRDAFGRTSAAGNQPDDPD